MSEKEQIERLQALSEIQTADNVALQIVVQRLSEFVRRDHPDTPDVPELFLKVRKHMLQLQLESMEKTHPAMAARLQQLIDQACTIYPYDYE
jgi:hypothetical protein